MKSNEEEWNWNFSLLPEDHNPAACQSSVAASDLVGSLLATLNPLSPNKDTMVWLLAPLIPSKDTTIWEEILKEIGVFVPLSDHGIGLFKDRHVYV